MKNILISLLIVSSQAYAQISFDNTQADEIPLGQAGNINAYVREIGLDSLEINWNVTDLEASGSDNIFMAYNSETHTINFKATYDNLSDLKTWMDERQKTKSGGGVTLGEWEITYVQSALGVPIFSCKGPTGNFEVGFSSQMRQNLMTKEAIKRAIEKYEHQKAREAERKAKKRKRKSKGN